MIILEGANDVLRIITSAAGDIDNSFSYVDRIGASTFTPGRANNAGITTATTTTVVAAPGASNWRNIKGGTIANVHGSVSNVVTVDRFDGATPNIVWKGTLLAGESVTCDAEGIWTLYTANGMPKRDLGAKLFNWSTAAQGPGFATDTYLTGSYIRFPAAPKPGTRYRLKFAVTKTAAGTATPIIQVRVGVAGTTADTSRNSFTFSAGTAATATGIFEVVVLFRAVGGGTSAVLQGSCSLVAPATTGISSLIKAVQTTSGGFDSTVASLGVGVSVNGGTSAAWTVQLVEAELENF